MQTKKLLENSTRHKVVIVNKTETSSYSSFNLLAGHRPSKGGHIEIITPNMDLAITHFEYT